MFKNNEKIKNLDFCMYKKKYDIVSFYKNSVKIMQTEIERGDDIKLSNKIKKYLALYNNYEEF